MIRASRFLLVPSCLMLAAAGAAPRSSVLVVHVADAATKEFIADAEVRLAPVGRVARTRSAGDAEFSDLVKGNYRIDVRAIGYAPADMTVELGGDKLRVSVSLDRTSTALDTVRVRAERTSRNLREFEVRRKHNVGRFFTDSALMDNRAKGLKWMLAMQIPGLMIRGNGVVSNEMGGSCPVYVWVDGLLVTPMPDGFINPKANGLAGVRQKQILDLEALRLEEFAGMEVYSTVEAPPQYRPPERYCKVVLLWSKW